MKIMQIHSWDVSYAEALDIQKALSKKIVLKRLPRKIRYVAGTDVAYSKRSRMHWAGVVVHSYPKLEKVDEFLVRGISKFPYIPGLLSFREIPLLLQALRLTSPDPDLILCDGQGIAHPRSMGLASHLGLLIQKPTIGCAKTRLVGTHSEVGNMGGDSAWLEYRGERIGAVVRTRTGVKPLFVSPGHRVTLEEAIEVVLTCRGRYRIPEPIRQAHLLVSRLRREEEAF